MIKALKSSLCAALCAVMILSSHFLTGSMTAVAENDSVLLYDNGTAPRRITLADDEFAVQFRVSERINGVRVRITNANSTGDKGSLTVALYKWSGSIGASVNSDPVAKARQEQLRAGDDALLSFDTQDAGEYVVCFSDGKGSLQLGAAAPLDTVRTYFNFSEYPRGIACEAVWAGAAGELLQCSDNVQTFVNADTWVATDGLGRKVENSTDADTRRQGKYVGLFFHTWHTSNSGMGSSNITEILKEHPEIRNDFKSPLWGSAGAYHWNEPIWGYYRSCDEWVLRKQAELLADAGVDAVFFDNTNGTATFIDDVLTLCRVWSRARADGVKTPQISFMLPMFDYDLVAIQLREIYAKLYSLGIYKELWFYWKGKPLMVGYPGRLDKKNETDKEILDFFNYRVINHAQSEDHVQVQDENGEPIVMGAIQSEVTRKYQLWNWISVYPQLVNRNKDKTPEEVAVAIAHNWCAETHLTAMNNPKYQVFGRHYDPVKGAVDDRPDAKLYGAYFSAQWDYALDIDPEFIWVTGWNEWVAGRFEDFWGVKNAFPDNFSDEYSRDIEPSKGDLKDHYYYQLVNYIRKFKGVSALPPVDEPVRVDIATGDGWDEVSRTYMSYPNDTWDRNELGYKSAATGSYYEYKNDTGRNDIVSCKATYDGNNVYFMAETKEDLTPYTDTAWMRLFIEVASVDGKTTELPGWESFNYVVNRKTPASDIETTLEKSVGGWEWTDEGAVRYSAKGNRIQVAVPRALLGLENARTFTVNFKWSDNMQSDGDILDLYENGDTAPEGRFKYQLSVVNAPEPYEEQTETEGATDAEETAPEPKKGKKTSFPLVTAIAAVSVAAAAVAAVAIVKKRRKKKKN